MGQGTEAHMKLVDEKGKLFGKLNIVDLLVIIVIVAAAALLAFKFLGGGSVGNGAAPKLIYTVRVMEVDQATYENVCQYVDSASGLRDQLMANGQLLDGYIVDVTATEHVASPNDEVGGETLDLLFIIEATPSDTVQNTVGTQEVRIGKTHIVKSQHIEFENGVIMTCQWETE